MLDFILDWIVDPVLDLFLCRFKWGNWLKHMFISALLFLPMLAFLAILFFAWDAGRWFWVIVGLAGTFFFAYLDFKYEWWWIREGRHLD